MFMIVWLAVLVTANVFLLIWSWVPALIRDKSNLLAWVMLGLSLVIIIMCSGQMAVEAYILWGQP